MRLGTAIECLVDNYKYASDKEWINDKVAWALYHTWKEANRKTENSSEIPNKSTISKMEQVDEPQRNMVEDIVESFGFKAESYRQAKAKTEPQAEIKGSERLVKGSERSSE